MIDTQVITIAQQQISLAIDDQNQRLLAEIAATRSQFNARGMLASGSMIVAVQSLCAEAVKERAAIVWEILHRIVTSVGINFDDSLGKELRTFVETYFPEHMDGLKYHVIEMARSTGMGDIVDRIPDTVGSTRLAALAKVSSEIALFVMTLKKAPSMQPHYSPQFHISHSTIGSLQTGNGAVANVHQSITPESRDALLRALEIIGREIDKVDELPGRNKAEIIELVAESKEELVKEKPNVTKLSAYLPTIGGALEVVANLKPAYDALKNAAALFGIPLP